MTPKIGVGSLKLNQGPKIGALAPQFTIETDAGEQLSLKDLRGQTVVLYFDP